MKKRIALAIICTALVFSCSDDGDDGGTEEFPSELVGSWSSTNFSRTDCTDTEDNATCDTSGCMTLTFASNGSYSGGFPEVVLQGTATGNTTSLKLCTPDNECTDVSYSLVSGTLTATWQDSEDGCTYAVTMEKT